MTTTVRPWLPKLFTALLVAALGLTPGRTVAADAAPLHAVGRILEPRDTTGVRMQTAEVHAHFRRSPGAEDFPVGYRADVAARFRLIVGADERILIGFPLGPSASSGRLLWAASLRDFTVSVVDGDQGRRLPHREEKVSVTWEGERFEERWAVWDLELAGGRPVTLEVRYWLAVETGRPWGDLRFYYVLATGRHWAGTIGEVTVRVTSDAALGPDLVRAGTTPGFRWTGQALEWAWRDLEPDFDLELYLANTFFRDALDEAERRFADPTPDLENLAAARAALMEAVASLDPDLFPPRRVDPDRVGRAIQAGVAAHERARATAPADPALARERVRFLWQAAHWSGEPGHAVAFLEAAGEYLGSHPEAAGDWWFVTPPQMVDMALRVFAGPDDPGARRAAVKSLLRLVPPLTVADEPLVLREAIEADGRLRQETRLPAEPGAPDPAIFGRGEVRVAAAPFFRSFEYRRAVPDPGAWLESWARETVLAALGPAAVARLGRASGGRAIEQDLVRALVDPVRDRLRVVVEVKTPWPIRRATGAVDPGRRAASLLLAAGSPAVLEASGGTVTWLGWTAMAAGTGFVGLSLTFIGLWFARRAQVRRAARRAARS